MKKDEKKFWFFLSGGTPGWTTLVNKRIFFGKKEKLGYSFLFDRKVVPKVPKMHHFAQIFAEVAHIWSTIHTF